MYTPDWYNEYYEWYIHKTYESITPFFVKTTQGILCYSTRFTHGMPFVARRAKNGANGWSRTADHRVMSPVLYRWATLASEGILGIF